MRISLSNSLMTVGSGFVTMHDWEQHHDTLPPAMKTHGDDVFSLAVFHQLHCLHFMLKEFNNLLPGGKHAKSRDGHGHGSGSDALKHVGHCFDYLRTSLMCCGDTALEGQAEGLDEPGTLGVGSFHMCKNYESIRSWAEMSRASNMVGFSD